jgi:hypothetical protein
VENTLSRNFIKKALLPGHNHLLTVIEDQQKIKPKYDACSLSKFFLKDTLWEVYRFHRRRGQDGRYNVKRLPDTNATHGL